MRHVSVVRLMSSVAIGSMCGLALVCHAETAPTLDQQLAAVDALRSGHSTPFDEVERRCNELLQRYRAPEDQGKIFYELAQVEGQSGIQRPEKLIEYAKKALDLPCEPLKRIDLYAYWAAGVQVAHRGAQGKELTSARRDAVVPYLLGLKVTLQYHLPEEAPPMPKPVGGGGAVTLGPSVEAAMNDPALVRVQRENRANREARDNWEFVCTMIRYRDELTDDIGFMYSQLPFATDELERIATATLQDDAAVTRLMEHVEIMIQAQVNALVAPVLQAPDPTPFDTLHAEPQPTHSQAAMLEHGQSATEAPQSGHVSPPPAVRELKANDHRSGSGVWTVAAIAVCLLGLSVLGIAVFRRTRR